jgi:hypothetical protein
MSNDRITTWRLLLEEYGPQYVHIAGKNNIVADALSRLEKDEDEKLSEKEEGLVLSHSMCAVEKMRKEYCQKPNKIWCIT